MVCHETYKDQKNNWVSPDEIITVNGKKFLLKDNTHEIKIGPSESMSKSKKNTIDPEKIINNYGADAVRLFILSDSPPEKDVQWSDDGMNSSFKFLQKLWILNQKILQEIKENHPKNSNNQLEVITAKFVGDVQKNIENFSYNKIIANFHEVYSAINKIINNKIDRKSWIKNYMDVLIVMNPVIPHFSNECIEKLSEKKPVNNVLWPKINKNVLIKDWVNFIVQINGKTRSILNIKKGMNEKELVNKIKTDQKIKSYLLDKEIKKTIFIEDKLINVII